MTAPKQPEQKQPKEKAIEVVSKLTSLTQQKKLTWHVLSSEYDQPDEIAGASFYTDYKGRRVRIARRRPKRDSMAFVITGTLWGGPSDYASLELIDNKGLTIWRFPYVSGLDDLYSAVQYQVAGVDQLLDDFLKD